MAYDLNQNSKAVIIGITDCGETVPAAAGRISTQTGTAMEIFEQSRGNDKNASLISKVTRSGHNSTIEHTVFNIAFQNVSVTVEQFVIEFRLASFTVKSRRYVDFASLGCYTPRFGSKSLETRYREHMEYLYSEYAAFIEAGVAKEDARFLLPYSLYSNFYCTLNARELLHMLYSMLYGRGSEITEIRELGRSIYEQASKMTPGIFTDFENRRPSSPEKPYFDYKELPGAVRSNELTELISYTQYPAQCIARAALIEHTNLSEYSIDRIVAEPDECGKIIEKIAATRRPRALESVNFTFRLNGVSLSCLTHFARHRMQSIGIPSLLSTDRNRFILPPEIAKREDLLIRYRDAFKKTAILCNEFRTEGVSEDLLVYLQLSGTALDIVTTMNGRELLLFLKLRTCNRAQWEVRAYAVEMLKKLRKISPEIFRFYGPGCYTGKCPEGPLTCGRAAETAELFKNL